MSKVFFTGDTHGSYDIHKLNANHFPIGNTLTKDDYLIICGDFGLIWYDEEDKETKYWLEWLNNKPWTTIVILGNHENYNAIYSNYPQVEFKGAKGVQVRDSIFIINRGEIFTIDGEKYFAFGGGFSIDRLKRTENKSWWKQELPTKAEVDYAVQKLDSVNWEVDYVITHDFPNTVLQTLRYKKYNPMEWYDPDQCDIQCILEFFCNAGLKYKEWYGGHLHTNYTIGKFHILYTSITDAEGNEYYEG